MNYTMIFAMLGGLGLFIYGMKLMGDGLQKAAGSRLKRMIEVLTRSPILGVLVGAMVTAIVQSSSATTVMTIGFVNAGIMNLTQAAGVIMGANIGTTITAQLIALNLEEIAPLILGIGAFISLFAHKKNHRQIGEILLGFGILFAGLTMMKDSMKPLASSPAFHNTIIIIGKSPILGVLVGTVVTAVIQSSSAAIGILQAMASSGAITLRLALPILFGSNIGTTVTAAIAGIGTSKNAKRASLLHGTFNIIGTIIFMLLLPVVLRVIPLLGGTVSKQIANAHTLFNIVSTIIILPFIFVFVRFAERLIPGGDDKEEELTLKYLDKRLLETPTVAASQVVQECIRMGKLASRNVSKAIEALISGDEKLINSVFEREKLINFLEKEITNYLVAISNSSLPVEQGNQIASMFHVVNDLERIGDHAENLAELAQVRQDLSCGFSPEATTDLEKVYEAVRTSLACSIKALETNDVQLAENALKEEIEIDSMEKLFRQNHFERLSQSCCTSELGTLFLDAISNLERIGDHSTNIAEIVIELH